MANRRIDYKLLKRQRQNDKEALNMVTHGSFKVDPGPSLLELMSKEINRTNSGFYKRGLVVGRSVVETWREGQQKPYHTLKEHVIRCKKEKADPEFIRGVATILAILIDPYGYLNKHDKFESTVNYVLNMEN